MVVRDGGSEGEFGGYIAGMFVEKPRRLASGQGMGKGLIFCLEYAGRWLLWGAVFLEKGIASGFRIGGRGARGSVTGDEIEKHWERLLTVEWGLGMSGLGRCER